MIVFSGAALFKLLFKSVEMLWLAFSRVLSFLLPLKDKDCEILPPLFAIGGSLPANGGVNAYLWIAR